MTTQSRLQSLMSKLANGEQLSTILIAAVVQGWALYGLHIAIDRNRWPATSSGWLIGLYAVAAFVPLTVQLLARHSRRALMWTIVAAVGVFCLFAGWHHGEWVMADDARQVPESGEWFLLAFILGVLWLLVMPFAQLRLVENRWRGRYSQLFASAWNNKLLLCEAVIFTGLFWLLLFLWAQLFDMLGIRFFRHLFDEPVFAYPVTTLVFGIALNLIGSVERLTRVLLEQLLNVLKWLALVAALILTLFTLALVTKLPGMIASGHRAIGAAWLLWLVAVTVLLVNAAYRDGAVESPYPRGIAVLLRCVVPLTVVISCVALYALWLRIHEHGMTVSRFWACVVAGAAVIYSVGYAVAARHRERWMAGIATVNVATALYLVAIIALALTPVLSPYRIAANSQSALARFTSVERDSRWQDPPLEYLRFSAGRYGMNRLRELARAEGSQSSDLRSRATAMLAREHRWDRGDQGQDTQTWLAGMARYPARDLEPSLMTQLQLDMSDTALSWAYQPRTSPLAGIFTDLDRDHVDEFILLTECTGSVYRKAEAAWKRVGTLGAGRFCRGQSFISHVAAGDLRAEAPQWDDLIVGTRRYTFLADEH